MTANELARLMHKKSNAYLRRNEINKKRFRWEQLSRMSRSHYEYVAAAILKELAKVKR